MPSKLAFDIGANVGTKTQELLAAGYDKVVAVEPLCDNRFPYDSRVVWVKCIISDTNGTKQIYPADTISTVNKAFMEGRFKGQIWDAPVDCPSMTLAELIATHSNPDYIKIDVEGYEATVMQGLPVFCDVPLLSFEWCSEFRDDAFKCVDVLFFLGYREFALQFEDAGVLPPSIWYDVDGLDHQFDELCHKHHLAWGQIWARK